MAPSPAARPDSTEVISAPRPDPARAALLGPFARIGSWWEERREGAPARTSSAAGRWSPLVAGLAAVVLVLLIGSVLLRDQGPPPVAVPDVVGETLADAATSLRAQGLTVDVSYRPVSDDEVGRVLETIPVADETLERGSRVHVIAGALASTPEPVVTTAPAEDDDDDRRRGRGKKKRNKD